MWRAYFIDGRWVLTADHLVMGRYATVSTLLREARDTHGAVPTIITRHQEA